VRSRGAGRRREEREARTAERAGGPMEREWHTWVISWKKISGYQNTSLLNYYNLDS
jgi:hypothetical protein